MLTVEETQVSLTQQGSGKVYGRNMPEEGSEGWVRIRWSWRVFHTDKLTWAKHTGVKQSARFGEEQHFGITAGSAKEIAELVLQPLTLTLLRVWKVWSKNNQELATGERFSFEGVAMSWEPPSLPPWRGYKVLTPHFKPRGQCYAENLQRPWCMTVELGFTVNWCLTQAWKT